MLELPQTLAVQGASLPLLRGSQLKYIEKRTGNRQTLLSGERNYYGH
jgi:hypothetical protein